MSNFEIVYRPTPEEGARAVERAREAVARGDPFETLPGNPPEHKVLAVLADGSKVRVAHVETVYNDWKFMDYCYHEGFYEKHADARVKEILALAKILYAAAQN